MNMKEIMSRIQLAVNVADLDEAIEFYTKFFKTAPAKVRTGYANFAIDDPPLKLVLIENGGAPGSLNHLGVEVLSTDAVKEAAKYLSDVGLETRFEDSTSCCFALPDKVWVDGVDGSPWETYTVLADAETELEGDATCCTSLRVTTPSSSQAATSCC
jgi:catechol 2,3-dioxygenase-like lactoylglutathione lyase family enzyme